MQENALKGIKVVELASVLAGPSVGSFLAELGATVVKAENPRTGGDTTRKWKTAAEPEDAPVSAYYASANWGKRVLQIDLGNPEELNRLHAELADADILLENFKPGDDHKFGLEYGRLKELYSKLIVGHIQGFPDDDRPAFDIVLQAESGFMSLNGVAGEPMKWPLPIVDILAAHQLKEGILLALLQRAQTGRGCFVSVSLFEAAVASLYNVAGNVLMGKADPVALGRLHPNIAPYGETLLSSDGQTAVLAVGTDQQFAQLCALLEMNKNFCEEFSTNEKRLKRRSELENELRKPAAQMTFAVLEAGLIGRKVPFGKVKSVKEVLTALPADSFLSEVQEGVNTLRMRTGIFRITQ